MASKPTRKLIVEVLTDRAEEILCRIAAGDELDDLGREYGIWPFHIRKFYAGSPEFRELYREALDSYEKMRAEARGGRGGDQTRLPETHEDIVARNEDAILGMLTDGYLVLEVAQYLEVQRAAITRYFRATEERKARYEAALNEEGADAMAERAVMAGNKPALDLVDAKMAELRSTRLAWLAGQRNAKYSPRQNIDLKGSMTHNVSIDIAP